jgi:predicted HTH transcriptional regulator
MPQRMIDELYAKRSLHTLHDTNSPNQFLTFEQLKIYYGEMGFTVDNENFLKNLGLYNEDGKFNYLAYLLADSNAVSVKIAKYAGTDKIKILHRTECGFCSLIKATKCMLSALDMYNKTAIEISSTRTDTPLVDEIALREAFMNAVLHNDYIRGAFPVVEFYSDRVEITSSGGLPLGLTREEFFNGVSHPRNHELMRIFLNMRLCEQLGSGMKKIMKAYRPEDYKITDNFVIARFKYNEHALAVLNGSEKFGESSEKVHGSSEKFAELSITKKRIIELIREDNTVTTDVMARSIGLTTRAIEKNLRQLKDACVIERRNGDRGGYWEIID